MLAAVTMSPWLVTRRLRPKHQPQQSVPQGNEEIPVWCGCMHVIYYPDTLYTVKQLVLQKTDYQTQTLSEKPNSSTVQAGKLVERLNQKSAGATIDRIKCVCIDTVTVSDLRASKVQPFVVFFLLSVIKDENHPVGKQKRRCFFIMNFKHYWRFQFYIYVAPEKKNRWTHEKHWESSFLPSDPIMCF